jgi:endonuclease-3
VILISQKNDPFAVLVSCIISLRTRDEVTEPASARLFKLAKSQPS